MTRGPDFDELVAGAGADERERLRRVHALLVEAGPPPELPPDLAAPTLAMTLWRPRRRLRRGSLLLAAALVVLALAVLGGYAIGRGSGAGGLAAARTLELVGTSAAPNARAVLRIDAADRAGNWPMQLGATGLPKLPPKGYYTVWLMRGRRPVAPCGTFVVAGDRQAVSVRLNAPYDVRPGDWWAVTKQLPGRRDVGPVVLRPTPA